MEIASELVPAQKTFGGYCLRVLWKCIPVFLGLVAVAVAVFLIRALFF